MSVIMSDYVWGQSAARGSARLVLLSLADRANRDGVCWPSIADIAARVLLGERQIRRALAVLVQAGEVRIIQRGGRKRQGEAGWANRILVVAGRSAAELSAVVAKYRHRWRQGNNVQNSDTGDGKHGHTRPLTRTPATANADAGDRGTISRTRMKPSKEPSEGADAMEQRPGAIAGTAAALPMSEAATAADPETELFNRQLSERRADAARAAGARTPRPAGSALAAAPRFKPRRRKGRIPDDEQRRTFELLRQVPGLNEDDARDLARDASYADFEVAIAKMNGNVRNPGGWLRRAVERGYGRAGVKGT